MIAMPLETPDFLAARYLPEPDGVVHTPRDKVSPIRGESDGSYTFVMPLETLEFSTGRHLPEPEYPELTICKDISTIRGEGDVVYNVMNVVLLSEMS